MATLESMQVSEEQQSLIMEDVQVLLPNYDDFVEDVLQQFMEENPETFQIFPWADASKTAKEMRSHPRFKSHAKSIGKVISDCLVDLNGVKKHEPKLSSLGAMHTKKKVPTELFGKLGGCILTQVVKRVSEAKWSEEKKEAWLKAYGIITVMVTE
ncbi:uncharacterized protein LOC134847992 [Symsagittifera roscoffensis]|uniref:Neuroglobin n=1 Tax=Symsagittifera roscoffensis TaxID=84072 RepID=L0PQJ5_SYMRO|nr:neuroglobin [Symsagittifera roscoffensis]